MKRTKNVSKIVKTGILFITVFFFTAYLLLNAYELFFKTDIQLVSSVTALEETYLFEELMYRNSNYESSPAFYIDGSDVTIETMRISNSNQVIRLSPMEIDTETGEILVRPAFGNSMFLNENSKRGTNTRVVVVLVEEGWRFDLSRDLLKTGSNIFLYTEDGAQMIFRSKENSTLESSQLLPVTLGQNKSNIDLILIVTDGDDVRYVHAKLISTLIE